MNPVNNLSQSPKTKKQAKQMKKALETLQNEMSESVLETMRTAGKPLDLAEIIAAYPNNERRRGCKNDKELKLYISMGLGSLIQSGQVRQLPKSLDGRYLLEVAE